MSFEIDTWHDDTLTMAQIESLNKIHLEYMEKYQQKVTEILNRIANQRYCTECGKRMKEHHYCDSCKQSVSVAEAGISYYALQEIMEELGIRK